MERGSVRSLGIVVVVLGACALAAGTASAAPTRMPVRVGEVPPLPPGTHVGATLPDARRLRLTVALAPRDSAGLAALATAVATPGSPTFRSYLSVAQFAQRFGATSDQVDAVSSALRAQGMTVGTPTANNLMLPVTGTASEVEQAFSVSLSQVRLPGGRSAYANDQAPTVGPTLGRYVQSVIGLDDVTHQKPQLSRSLRARSRAHSLTAEPQAVTSQPQAVTGGPQPCTSALRAQSGGYSADLFATAYQFTSLYGAGDLGAGQTVALFEQQPYNPVDVSTYQACYQTAAAVTPIDVDGGPGPYAAPPGSGDGESALDIETVIGLAPRANVLVYQGPATASAPVDILGAIISQNKAKVISSSWGACEALTGGPVMTAENTLLQEAAIQGQSFFISSGDSGSSMCFQANQSRTELSVLSPASEPFATGVGGTALFEDAANPSYYDASQPPLEGVWNDGYDGQRAHGTGGGISSQWAMPAYQSGAAASLGVTHNGSNAPCSAASFCREVPDVAADADPNTGYSIFADGQWAGIGGTSASAPLWASFIALANASAACRGLPVGFVNPSLYAIAGSSYLNNFTDVTLASPFSGATSNDALGVNNGSFPLASGYDMATGLGTPLGKNLAATLCGLRAPVYSVGVANPGARQTVVKKPVSLKVNASDSGGAALTYRAAGLPAGLAINPATGVISGTPTVAQKTTVTVAAADAFTNQGSTQFAWTIVKPKATVKRGRPSVAHPSLNGVAKRKAHLTFTVGEGRNAPAVHAIVVASGHGLSFSKSSKKLKKHVAIKSARGKRVAFKAKVKHGKLTLTLSRAQTKAKVAIGYPALRVSRSLAHKVKHHKLKKLALVLKAIDTHHKATRLTLKSKPR